MIRATFLALASVAVIAGCDTTTSGSTQQLAPTPAADYMVRAVIAKDIGQICPGISAVGNPEQLVRGYLDARQAAGDSLAVVAVELDAFTEESRDAGIAQYLNANGITGPEALCAQARREMAAGSQIGRLLQ